MAAGTEHPSQLPTGTPRRLLADRVHGSRETSGDDQKAPDGCEYPALCLMVKKMGSGVNEPGQNPKFSVSCVTFAELLFPLYHTTICLTHKTKEV